MGEKMRTNKLFLAKHSLIVLFFQNEYKYEAMIRRHFTTKILSISPTIPWGYHKLFTFLSVNMEILTPISVPILIFLFVKRGDNRHLSSASKQKWQNGYPEKRHYRV
jgi:hypothetical protein